MTTPDLVTSSGQLTPEGRKAVTVLQKYYDESPAKADQMLDIQRRSYFAFVVEQKLMTPAKFFADYPAIAADLWGLVMRQLPDDDPGKLANEVGDAEAAKQAWADRHAQAAQDRANAADARSAALARAAGAKESLITPSGGLTPSGGALVERLDAVCDALPDNYVPPKALARYLLETTILRRLTPVQFFTTFRDNTAELLRLVPILEAEAQQAVIQEKLETLTRAVKQHQRSTPSPASFAESTASVVRLTESIDMSQADDEGTAVIKNVVLIRAGMSLNRTYYSEAVLRAAAPKFEGVAAFNNHSTTRKVSDLTGYYRNVRFENGALRADRFFTSTAAGKDAYAVARQIASGRAPATLAGLSISAGGRAKKKQYPDGEAQEVLSIDRVESCDDVISPAAKGSYRSESYRGGA